MPASAASAAPRALLLAIAHRGDPCGRRPVPKLQRAQSIVEAPFSYASAIAPDPDYYENINRTKTRTERQGCTQRFARHFSRLPQRPPPSDGSLAIASALRRSQAVSIADCSRLAEGRAVKSRRNDRQIFDHRDARAAQEASSSARTVPC